MKNGTCRLCGADGVTLEKSHIISKFFLRPFDFKPKGIVVCDLEAVRETDKSLSFNELTFTKHLLCGNCEDFFSEAETEVRRVLFEKGSPLKVKISKVESSIIPSLGMSMPYSFLIKGIDVVNIDFKLFRRFALSIWWRIFVCSDISKYCAAAKTSPEIAEEIRQLIISDLSSSKKFVYPEDLYAVWLFKLDKTKHVRDNETITISPLPLEVKQHGNNVHTDKMQHTIDLNPTGLKAFDLVLGGYIWTLICGRINSNAVRAKSDGTLPVFVLDAKVMLYKVKEFPQFREFLLTGDLD